jgi:hypothetical protein
LLAGTQTLFEPREYFFPGSGLDATGIDVIDSSPNLFLPLLTEIEAVQALGYCFDQVRAFARRQLKGGFQDSVRFSHEQEASR